MTGPSQQDIIGLEDDEKAVIAALTKLDADILRSFPHFGSVPGEGPAEWLAKLVERQSGTGL